MSQIKNATALRLKINKNWSNMWFSKKSSTSVIEDMWISHIIKGLMLNSGNIINQVQIKRQLSKISTNSLIAKIKQIKKVNRKR